MPGQLRTRLSAERISILLPVLLAAWLPFTAEAVSNEALGKSATQSSIYAVHHDASEAVDGDRNGNYYAPSVAHTNTESGAWWEVDLAGDFVISEIRVYNRTDSSGAIEARIDPFRLSIFDGVTSVWSLIFDPDADLDYTLSEDLPGGYSDEIRGWAFVMPDPDPTGDRVRIQLVNADGTPRTNYLQLAEVEVYGEASTAVAEPATLLLLGSGVAAIGVWSSRRRGGEISALSGRVEAGAP